MNLVVFLKLFEQVLNYLVKTPEAGLEARIIFEIEEQIPLTLFSLFLGHFIVAPPFVLV